MNSPTMNYYYEKLYSLFFPIKCQKYISKKYMNWEHIIIDEMRGGMTNSSNTEFFQIVIGNHWDWNYNNR